jgi:hypothetical protein
MFDVRLASVHQSSSIANIGVVDGRHLLALSHPPKEEITLSKRAD